MSYDNIYKQYETIEECKKDILKHDIIPYRTDDGEDDGTDVIITDTEQDEIDKIFNENMKTAEKIYFLVEKKNFAVLNESLDTDNKYRCMIKCYDYKTEKELLSILKTFESIKVVKIASLFGTLFISQIEKRSYLYSALFENRVVSWIHRLRKLIP